MQDETIHILLADDDESDRLLFTEAFEELSMKAFAELSMKAIVCTVNNGKQLLDWLGTEGNLLPQFIFLDLNMPRMNGIECLKKVRSNEELNSIFIAIYSTSANKQYIEEAFLNGANVYIVKPNSFSVLKELLNKVVAGKNTFNRDNFLLSI